MVFWSLRFAYANARPGPEDLIPPALQIKNQEPRTEVTITMSDHSGKDERDLSYGNAIRGVGQNETLHDAAQLADTHQRQRFLWVQEPCECANACGSPLYWQACF